MKNNLPRLAASAACLLPVLLFLPLFHSAASSPTPGVEPPKSDSESHGFAGTMSCTGRGCHGAITPNKAPDLRQDEFSTWVRHDPHAGAYAVLKGARLVLTGWPANLAATRMADQEANPGFHEDRSGCLACHSTPGIRR